MDKDNKITLTLPTITGIASILIIIFQHLLIGWFGVTAILFVFYVLALFTIISFYWRSKARRIQRQKNNSL